MSLHHTTASETQVQTKIAIIATKSDIKMQYKCQGWIMEKVFKRFTLFPDKQKLKRKIKTKKDVYVSFRFHIDLPFCGHELYPSDIPMQCFGLLGLLLNNFREVTKPRSWTLLSAAYYNCKFKEPMLMTSVLVMKKSKWSVLGHWQW